ncbi:hypothetical protein ACLTEW_15300 [Gordonia lacunae]
MALRGRRNRPRGLGAKAALELKADAMKPIAGDDALKTELREWMWECGLP